MATRQLLEQISDHSPDVIGVSLTSRQWLRAAQLISEIKQHFDLPVIAGGLHPTFASDMVLESPGFDFVCIGEGELAMLDFVTAYESGQPVNGLTNIRAKGKPMPALRPPLESLDDLPFVARDMLGEKYGVIHISTQRGCPYPCSYCAAPKIADLYDGGYSSYGRRRSVENVIAELAEIQCNGELNYVVFLDDTFSINHAWVKQFCALYSDRFGIPFSINARAETINPQLLRTLANAGCMHIIYGVESGSEKVRRVILKRNISNERLIDVFRWTREAGIMVTANYMLGIPGEEKSDIEQTLSLHDQLQPDDFGYFVFYPYPGTPLFQVCKEKGYLPNNYYELPAVHRSSILTLPDLSKEDIEIYYDRFTQLRIRDHMKNAPAGGGDGYKGKIIKQTEDAAARG
jgi:radical SAM superfamily enzyme YgiQ (UPF0313 family)